LHCKTWYTGTCGRTAMGLLLYELFLMVKSLQCVMIGLRSNGYFVTGTPCLNGGHNYGFASNVGHPRSDSVELLVYDGKRTYPEHQCCITSLSGQCQPYWKGVNILGIPYGMNYDIYVNQKVYFCMISPCIKF